MDPHLAHLPRWAGISLLISLPMSLAALQVALVLLLAQSALCARIKATSAAAAPHPQPTDCPDAFWDCLRDDDNQTGPIASGHHIHQQHQLEQQRSAQHPSYTGGGFSYGTCMSWAHLACLPCNPRDERDAEWILAQCNREVLECQGQCR